MAPARPPPERATARYAFEPLKAHQLELRANDNLEVWVTDESWWLARNQRGEEGRVPSGHVQLGDWNDDSDADMADDAPAPKVAPNDRQEAWLEHQEWPDAANEWLSRRGHPLTPAAGERYRHVPVVRQRHDPLPEMPAGRGFHRTDGVNGFRRLDERAPL